jgi:hypothetical protein
MGDDGRKADRGRWVVGIDNIGTLNECAANRGAEGEASVVCDATEHRPAMAWIEWDAQYGNIIDTFSLPRANVVSGIQFATRIVRKSGKYLDLVPTPH